MWIKKCLNKKKKRIKNCSLSNCCGIKHFRMCCYGKIINFSVHFALPNCLYFMSYKLDCFGMHVCRMHKRMHIVFTLQHFLLQTSSATPEKKKTKTKLVRPVAKKSNATVSTFPQLCVVFLCACVWEVYSGILPFSLPWSPLVSYLSRLSSIWTIMQI